MSFSLCRESLRFCDYFPIKFSYEKESSLDERSTSLPKPEFRKERYFQTNRPNGPLAIRFPGNFISWAGLNSAPQKTSWGKTKNKKTPPRQQISPAEHNWWRTVHWHLPEDSSPPPRAVSAPLRSWRPRRAPRRPPSHPLSARWSPRAPAGPASPPRSASLALSPGPPDATRRQVGLLALARASGAARRPGSLGRESSPRRCWSRSCPCSWTSSPTGAGRAASSRPSSIGPPRYRLPCCLSRHVWLEVIERRE